MNCLETKILMILLKFYFTKLSLKYRYYEISIEFEEQLFNRYHKAYDKLKEKIKT